VQVKSHLQKHRIKVAADMQRQPGQQQAAGGATPGAAADPPVAPLQRARQLAKAQAQQQARQQAHQQQRQQAAQPQKRRQKEAAAEPRHQAAPAAKKQQLAHSRQQHGRPAAAPHTPQKALFEAALPVQEWQQQQQQQQQHRGQEQPSPGTERHLPLLLLNGGHSGAGSPPHSSPLAGVTPSGVSSSSVWEGLLPQGHHHPQAQQPATHHLYMSPVRHGSLLPTAHQQEHPAPLASQPMGPAALWASAGTGGALGELVSVGGPVQLQITAMEHHQYHQLPNAQQQQYVQQQYAQQQQQQYAQEQQDLHPHVQQHLHHQQQYRQQQYQVPHVQQYPAHGQQQYQQQYQHDHGQQHQQQQLHHPHASDSDSDHFVAEALDMLDMPGMLRSSMLHHPAHPVDDFGAAGLGGLGGGGAGGGGRLPWGLDSTLF
jgi:hypothetical protein